SSTPTVSAALIWSAGTPAANSAGSYMATPSGTIWQSIGPTAKRSIRGMMHPPLWQRAGDTGCPAGDPPCRLKCQLDHGRHRFARIPPLGIGLLRLVPGPAQPCPSDDRPNQLKTQPPADRASFTQVKPPGPNAEKSPGRGNSFRWRSERHGATFLNAATVR